MKRALGATGLFSRHGSVKSAYYLTIDLLKEPDLYLKSTISSVTVALIAELGVFVV